MDDGAVLLADRYVPRNPAWRRRAPTVLVRSPYGRRGPVGLLFGRLLAERGLQAVVQSVRGTFGSGGAFDPFDERADGLATLALAGRAALAPGPDRHDRAELPGARAVGGRRRARRAGAVGHRVAVPRAGQRQRRHLAGDRAVVDARARGAGAAAAPLLLAHGLRRTLPGSVEHLPIADARRARVGEPGAVLPRVARATRRGHARTGPPATTRRRSPTSSAPVQLVGGWYDIFLPWMLEDFEALRDAGRSPQLIVGPWTHTSPELAGGQRARGHRVAARAPARRPADGPRRARARLRHGRARWRELDDWPPPGRRGARRCTCAGRRARRDRARGRTPRPLPLRPGRPDARRRRRHAAGAASRSRQPRARGARRRAHVHRRAARARRRRDRPGPRRRPPALAAAPTPTSSCASATCTPTARR